MFKSFSLSYFCWSNCLGSIKELIHTRRTEIQNGFSQSPDGLGRGLQGRYHLIHPFRGSLGLVDLESMPPSSVSCLEVPGFILWFFGTTWYLTGRRVRTAGVLTWEKGSPLMPCEIALAFRREYTSSGGSLALCKRWEKGLEKCVLEGYKAESSYRCVHSGKKIFVRQEETF